MSAFKALKDASKKFEEDLHRVSNELFSAKIEESFEDSIAKKLRDLSLYRAKLRLLRAKPLSLIPQVTEQERDEETTFAAYGETAETRIIEQQLVKSATQAQAVKALVTAPSSSLDPEMVERKEKIIAALSAYRTQEAIVQHLDTLLQEKEAELADVRAQWDVELGVLRDMRGQSSGPELDVNDVLYKKLSSKVDKLELMRWLAGRLGVPRSCGYDWLTDPHRRLRAIRLAREHYTVDKFLQDNEN